MPLTIRAWRRLFIRICFLIFVPTLLPRMELSAAISGATTRSRLQELKTDPRHPFQKLSLSPCSRSRQYHCHCHALCNAMATYMPGKKDIRVLSKRYNLNFRQLIQVAKRNNLSFPERMAALATLSNNIKTVKTLFEFWAKAYYPKVVDLRQFFPADR